MHIDYLRLSTFDPTARAMLLSCLPSDSRKATHWLNYAGNGGQHTFEGVGEQRGKRHYIAHASGPLAHEFARKCLDVPLFSKNDTVRCRRIDIAHDIERNFLVRELADELAEDHENVTLMQSTDGWTIYLNKRRGAFMTRIYWKNDRAMTRLEFECKQQLAEQVWSWLLPDTVPFGALVPIYSQLLLRAKLTYELNAEFALEGLEGIQAIKLPKVTGNTEAKIQWAFGAMSGIEKLIANHETRDRMLDALEVFASAMLHKYQD